LHPSEPRPEPRLFDARLISPRYPHTRHTYFVEGTECRESLLWRL
jgi:hypothetical protein